MRAKFRVHSLAMCCQYSFGRRFEFIVSRAAFIIQFRFLPFHMCNTLVLCSLVKVWKWDLLIRTVNMSFVISAVFLFRWHFQVLCHLARSGYMNLYTHNVQAMTFFNTTLHLEFVRVCVGVHIDYNTIELLYTILRVHEKHLQLT